MFYDAARREIVLAVADASTLQTWRWNGTAWARATPPSSPPWRLDFALAYDAKRAVGVLFGGVTSTAVLDDTWTWNGTTWTSMSSVLRPPARRSAAMAFDAPREEMLLFGGLVLGGRLSTDDTWRWDGSQWTEARVDVAPPPRYDASMVHHALRGETLLFGGASDAVSYNDTWRWNGTTWQKATFNATPTERQDASMIYDPQRRRVVMFGGTYDASVWTLDYLGGGCVADADCPGTFCTDGVCCRVRECGSCETCNGLTPGTCSAVLNREDSDTCAVRNGKSCDDVGTCRGALGIAATAAETCASAIVADGVCCDTACNGPCASCLAETKEGHERSGTCGNRDPALCACAASSDCAQFHHCEQGRCAADRGATCENDHTLVDPAGARSDCGLYRCVGSTCLLACKSRSDCNANSDCTGDGRCVAFAETAADAGCNLHASRRGPLPRTAGAYVVLFWGAFSWLRRRRSARPKRRSAFVRTVLVALPLMVLASAVPRARDAAAQRGPAITAPRYDAVAWHRDATFSMSYGAAAWDSARGEAIAYGGIDNHLTWRWDGAHWTAIEAAPTPPRSSVHMVYDAARRVMVLRSDNRDDTWLWDGAAWLQVRPAHSPGAVPTSALVYDGARQRVLLAGSAEFWLWDGTDWAQAQPPTRPPARVLQLMAYDAARQRVVLFGGATLLPVNDTWLWDGTTWTQATSPTQPEAHIYGTLTYDAARQRVVLFGGNDDNRAETSTTWLWDGSAWTRANPATRPPPRTHASSFYDTTRSRVTFVGGRRNAVRGFGELSDSWTWDGSAWALREANMHPTARAWNGFAYDEARGTALMFGGTNADVTSNDTWRFDGDHWTEIALAVNPPIADDPRAGGLVYDAARSEVLLLLQVAGAMQTWRWNGATWTRTLPSTSPTARISFGLAYDAKHGEAVLFGGGQSSSLADTWTWNGTTWAPRTPAQSPRARSQHSMAYDALREEIVLFGGLPDDGSTELLGDTWRWNGSTWSEAKAVLSPPARRAAQMAFHGARGEVVLFGGHTEQQVLDDTWRWNGVAWSEAVPSESPLARSYGSLIYMPQRKRIVLFGGINDLGTTTNDDSTWQMAFLGAGCTSDTECPGASCNDGVCCRVKACGSCETCNGLTPGACSAVLNREDADTCALHDGKSCSDVGTCLAADGRAATAPTECASGSLADGVCCDSKCNGPCQSCVAESKEAHGGTGTCGNRVPSTCMCASNDDCAKFHHCEGGVCAIDRGAVCADDRTVVDPAGVRTDCGLYRCKGSECLPACKSREDCINDADCTSDGRCVAFGTSSGEKGGCNVHASGGMGCLGASLGFAAPIAACLARRGRRRIVRRPLQRPRGTRGRRASSASTAP